MDLKIKNNNNLKLEPIRKLSFIRTTGNQSIDLGVHATPDLRIQMKFTLYGVSSGIIYGEFISGSDSEDYRLFTPTFGGVFMLDIMNSRMSTNKTKSTYCMEVGNNYIVDLETNQTLAKGSTLSFNQTSYTMKLLKDVNCSLFYAKLYKGNTMIMHLIPVLDSNGVACLFDLKNENFYYDVNNRNFTAGEEESYPMLPLSATRNISTLFHQDVPLINGLSLINNILQIQESNIQLCRVRADIGNVSGSITKLLQYADMAGFNDAGEEQTKPRLVGTWTLNDWYTQEQLAQAQAAFDGLTIIADPNYLINFDDLAVQVLDSTKPNYNPPIAIALQAAGYGNTLDEAPINGQTGRWLITKAQAAAVTSIITFQGMSSVTDNNKIVSNDITVYTTGNFLEFKYFIGVTWVPDMFGRDSFIHNIVFPSSITTVGGQGLFLFNSNVFVEITGVNISNINGNYFLAGGSNKIAHVWQSTKPTISGYIHPPFESASGIKLLLVGSGTKYDCARAYENWGPTFGIGTVKSWYDYAAPQLSYDGTNVTITVERDSTIYYTTDGTTPTVNSTEYTEPFVWDGTGVIKAMAVDETNIIGDIAYADDFYAAIVETPVISYNTTTRQITLSSNTPNTTIHFTLDGTYPTFDSPTYSGPIDATELEDIVKVRCFAIKDGMNDSKVVSKICVMDDSLWGTDGDTSFFAVQCIDSTKPNYNPAVCIILNRHSKLTDSCSSAGGYISKEDAAAITAMWTISGASYQGFWFQAIETVTDSNRLVTNEIIVYEFDKFDEFVYFTQIGLGVIDGSGHGFFHNCKKLKYITIPVNANSLERTFWGCHSLERVTGIDHVTHIGQVAFCDCVNLLLTQSDINPNIKTIRAQAFANCAKITINTIPAQITNIDENGIASVTMNTFKYTISVPYIHFLSETPITGVLCNYARTHGYNTFYQTTYKIYVGDGSSAAHDDAVLEDYRAASNWAGMVSYLDTWYNYLHPQS